jgi:hypothetical protein
MYSIVVICLAIGFFSGHRVIDSNAGIFNTDSLVFAAHVSKCGEAKGKSTVK